MVQEEGNTCIHTADSFHQTAEINTTWQSNYQPSSSIMCSAVLTLETPVDYRAHSHADYRTRDPVDSRPPGSSVHGISHKNIAVGCHFLLQGSSQLRDQTYYALNLKRKRKSFSCLQSPAPSALPAPLTGASPPLFQHSHHAPASPGFSLLLKHFKGVPTLCIFSLVPPSVLNAIFKFLTSCFLPMIHISAKSLCL